MASPTTTLNSLRAFEVVSRRELPRSPLKAQVTLPPVSQQVKAGRILGRRRGASSGGYNITVRDWRDLTNLRDGRTPVLGGCCDRMGRTATGHDVQRRAVIAAESSSRAATLSERPPGP